MSLLSRIYVWQIWCSSFNDLLRNENTIIHIYFNLDMFVGWDTIFNYA